jgi:hypothetical protein
MPDTRSRLIVVALALTMGIAAAAQEPPPPSDLQFEAASIRPSGPGGPPISGTTIQGNWTGRVV